MVKSSTGFSEYTGNDPDLTTFSSVIPTGLLGGSGYDFKTGWFSVLRRKSDYVTGKVQIYMYNCGPGDSMYELEW